MLRDPDGRLRSARVRRVADEKDERRFGWNKLANEIGSRSMQTGGIAKVNWDITYACPLRCTHCYSESGRRAARQLSSEDLSRLVDVLCALRPGKVSISGGEPLLVKGLASIGGRLRAAGIHTALFTGAWGLTPPIATELGEHFPQVCVSVDGATEATHDFVRQRNGSFAAAIRGLELLDHVAEARLASSRTPMLFGIEYTVVRSNLGELERLVEEVIPKFPRLGLVRIGAAIPIGLASRETFVERELLDEADFERLMTLAPRLGTLAPPGVSIVVGDVRQYLFRSEWRASQSRDREGHIEPDGRLRAFPIYEGTVGSLLDEPFERLWERVIAFREDPYVVQQLAPVRSLRDWASATRNLDWRFGSDADRERISARPAYTLVRATDPLRSP